MKTTETIKKTLHVAAASEAHATLQYAADAATVDNWGIPRLAERFKKESAEEASHLQRFLDRIAFVECDPSFPVEDTLPRKSVTAIINAQLEMEQTAVDQYQESAEIAWKTNDKGTASLFLDILKDEEGHLNWLEGQKSLLDTLGEKMYILHWISS